MPMCGGQGLVQYGAEEPEYAFRKRIEVVHHANRRDPAFKPAGDEFVFHDGVRLAGELTDSGRALAALEKIIEVSNRPEAEA